MLVKYVGDECRLVNHAVRVAYARAFRNHYKTSLICTDYTRPLPVTGLAKNSLHPTQSRSFRRRSSQPITWLQTDTNKQNSPWKYTN